MSSLAASAAAPASPVATAPRLSHILPLGWEGAITQYLREGERGDARVTPRAATRPVARTADAPTFDIGGYVVGDELLEALLIVKTPG